MSAQDDVLAAFGEPRQEVAPVADDGAGAVGDGAPGTGPKPDAVASEAGHTAIADDRPDAETRSETTAAPDERPLAKDADAVQAVSPAPVGEGESGTAEPRRSPDADAEGESPVDEPQDLPAVDGESVAVESVAVGPPDADNESAAGAPEQLYLDPSAFFTQLQAEVAEPKRRWPRLVMRYGSALVVAAAVAAGTAYGVTVPQRTDVPFLATPSDGRYDFPALARPLPPVGKPAPGDDANAGQVHYGDLRRYLLPAPKGAVVKEDGWEPVTDFLSAIQSPVMPGRFYDAGLRRIAWRGWTTPDGQHTVVELLQFPDHDAAFTSEDVLKTWAPPKVGKREDGPPIVTVPAFGDLTQEVAMRKFDEVEGLPGQVERRAVFRDGDVVAIVTTTAPQRVGDLPTDQVLLLQAEMLR